MESTAIHEEVLQLSKDLDHTLQLLNQGNWKAMENISSFRYGHLGELQTAYQVFMQSFILLQPYLTNGLYIRRKEMIQQDLQNNEALKKRLQLQVAVHEKDLRIANEDFAVKEQLYKQKVLALLEYKQEESKLLNKQLPLENTKTALINNEISISAKEQELVQLEQQIIDHKNGFMQALNVFMNEVKKWEAQYLLIAPENGTVTFLSPLQENQDFKVGQELCYITPANNLYYGEMLLAQENFGKIRTGQQVLIKLAGYPYQEYGRLIGHITFISGIPDKDRKYAATVALDNGLQTDYGKSLEFRNALTADAEVVTNKTRLAFKFLYTLRYIWHRQ
jgi:HlyD family secretion protein